MFDLQTIQYRNAVAVLEATGKVEVNERWLADALVEKFGADQASLDGFFLEPEIYTVQLDWRRAQDAAAATAPAGG